jgi:RNA polymerase sigma-70 factor (sigma-E family)
MSAGPSRVKRFGHVAPGKVWPVRCGPAGNVPFAAGSAGRLAGAKLICGERVFAGYGWGVSVGGDHVVAGARGDGATPRGSHAGTEGQGDSGRAAAAGARITRVVPGPPPPRREPGPGDPAFREYVTTRSGSLLRMAYLLTRNRADAEDLVQAALAKTFQAWDRIQDHGAVDGYVRRAMVNTHISWWRRRRVEEYPTDDIPDQPVVDHASGTEMQDALRRAIERLPERMRAAVVLRYYEDMSEAEIADVLGVSQGTVKSTVSRAVAKLRIDADLLDG